MYNANVFVSFITFYILKSIHFDMYHLCPKYMYMFVTCLHFSYTLSSISIMTLRIYFHNNMYNIILKLIHSFGVTMFSYQIRFKQKTVVQIFYSKTSFFQCYTLKQLNECQYMYRDQVTITPKTCFYFCLRVYSMYNKQLFLIVTPKLCFINNIVFI